MGNSELGIIVRLDNFFERLSKLKDDYLDTKNNLIKKQNDLINELKKTNPYEVVIEKLENELEQIDKLLGVDKKWVN